MTTEEITREAFPRYRRLSLSEQQALVATVRYALDNPQIEARAFHMNYFYECQARGVGDIATYDELPEVRRESDIFALETIRGLREQWEGRF